MAENLKRSCGDCEEFVDRISIDINVVIGTRSCDPPPPHGKRVLDCAGCVRQKHPPTSEVPINPSLPVKSTA